MLKSKKSNIDINDFVNIDLSMDDKKIDKNNDDNKNDFVNIELNEVNKNSNSNNNINKIRNESSKSNISFNSSSSKNDMKYNKDNIYSNKKIKDNNKEIYPDFEKQEENINNKEKGRLSFEMVDDDEVEKLRILTNNKKDFTSFDPSDDIVNKDSSDNTNIIYSSKNKILNKEKPKNDIKDIMKLYNLLLEENNNELLKNKEYFIVTEKEEITDLLGKHKLYEIAFVNSANFKLKKCYRRFKHFSLLNERLKKKYPYIIIPKFPLPKDFSQIIISDKVFDENRLFQLNFYLNFMLFHENLRKIKNFINLQKSQLLI